MAALTNRTYESAGRGSELMLSLWRTLQRLEEVAPQVTPPLDHLTDAVGLASTGNRHKGMDNVYSNVTTAVVFLRQQG